MARNEIPDWDGWVKSKPWDDGKGPDREILAIKKAVREESYRRKTAYGPLLKRGANADRPYATYLLGPIDLPLDFFTSSRWNERRTYMPLPLDRDGWELCWRNWRGSNSYRGIRAHIEKYGLRRPIIAEWFVNCDPTKLTHRAFAFRLEDPSWPFLILRTGNERLMMAMFEWGWETIPVTIYVRDCGWDSAVSALVRYLVDFCPPWLRTGYVSINRPIEEKRRTCYER